MQIVPTKYYDKDVMNSNTVINSYSYISPS